MAFPKHTIPHRRICRAFFRMISCKKQKTKKQKQELGLMSHISPKVRKLNSALPCGAENQKPLTFVFYQKNSNIQFQNYSFHFPWLFFPKSSTYCIWQLSVHNCISAQCSKKGSSFHCLLCAPPTFLILTLVRYTAASIQGLFCLILF